MDNYFTLCKLKFLRVSFTFLALRNRSSFSYIARSALYAVRLVKIGCAFVNVVNSDTLWGWTHGFEDFDNYFWTNSDFPSPGDFALVPCTVYLVRLSFKFEVCTIKFANRGINIWNYILLFSPMLDGFMYHELSNNSLFSSSATLLR